MWSPIQRHQNHPGVLLKNVNSWAFFHKYDTEPEYEEVGQGTEVVKSSPGGPYTHEHAWTATSNGTISHPIAHAKLRQSIPRKILYLSPSPHLIDNLVYKFIF